jgi:hypothetical protein
LVEPCWYLHVLPDGFALAVWPKQDQGGQAKVSHVCLKPGSWPTCTGLTELDLIEQVLTKGKEQLPCSGTSHIAVYVTPAAAVYLPLLFSEAPDLTADHTARAALPIVCCSHMSIKTMLLQLLNVERGAPHGRRLKDQADAAKVV